ncbi:MAG: hypothetical protein RBS58_06710 [Syntrophales bacterium]|nr:hypothetical protein [Syntrophales bacterium]MDX9922327.1 hypothetical protein [Syntrophales bacterium]
MRHDLLLKMGCLLCAAILLAAVAGCGKKGDPRPQAPVTTMKTSACDHAGENVNKAASAGTACVPPDTGGRVDKCGTG